MKRFTAGVVAALLLAATVGAVATPAAAAGSANQDATECSYPVTATDATGTEVTVDGEPERIVTLAPSAAQTLWELGAADKVVGVSDNAMYLDGADEKEVVSEGRTYRTESIVGLEPDLVLAPNVVPDDTVQSLRDSGLTVYNFGPTANFSALYEKTELTGRLAGECDAAAATVDDMRQRLTAIEEAVADEDRPGAMYSFYGFTAGAGTFIDSIITSAGVENVAATEMGITGFPQEAVNTEVIVNNSDSIEWLILNSEPGSHPTSEAYNQTAALRNNRTVVVNTNYLNQPAPRTVQAVETIAQAIHPEAYEEAQAALATDTQATQATDAGTATTTASATASPTDSTDETTPLPATTDDGTPVGGETAQPEATATSGDGPGFTALTGVVAALAAAVLVRRDR